MDQLVIIIGEGKLSNVTCNESVLKKRPVIYNRHEAKWSNLEQAEAALICVWRAEPTSVA